MSRLNARVSKLETVRGGKGPFLDLLEELTDAELETFIAICELGETPDEAQAACLYTQMGWPKDRWAAFNAVIRRLELDLNC